MSVTSIIVSKNIILTELKKSDMNSYIKYFNDEEIHKNLVSDLMPYTEEKFMYFYNLTSDNTKKFGRPHLFAIRSSKSNELIGHIDISEYYTDMPSKISYWLARPYWNKGIMSDTIRTFTGYLFNNYGIESVQADVVANNNSSCKALEKSGFRKISGEKNIYILKHDSL